jgi:flagellar biosynthesis protein FlhF
MILRRVTGTSVRDALARAEQECGSGVLILETRMTTQGAELIALKPQPEPKPAAPRRRGGFAELAANARARGLSEVCVRTIERALRGLDVELDRPGDPALISLAKKVLASLITTVPAADTPRALALIGPTGVGKTTTLAKLAARARRDEGRTVALVTLDLHRVAAVEQLRAFAEMLRVPLEVAFTPADLRRALHAHAGADRVFVDTAGRSPREREALAHLARAFTDVPIARALCVPAAARRQDLVTLRRACAPLAPTSLVITKWDETDAPGEVVSYAAEEGIPLLFLTDGQEVPEAIRPAAPTWIATSLIEGSA